MSPKLKRLSAAEIISSFKKIDFEIERQKGSHIKLRRVVSSNQRQTITIPNHGEIATGTLRAIARQASRYLTKEQILDIFYSD